MLSSWEPEARISMPGKDESFKVLLNEEILGYSAHTCTYHCYNKAIHFTCKYIHTKTYFI